MSREPPPSDQCYAEQALITLQGRVDAHFDAAKARSPEAIQCRAGCDHCCHQRLSVFRIEGEAIAEALARLGQHDPKLRARVRHQADDPDHGDRCPLLVEGTCTVYAERPLICRSHGVPVAVTDAAGHLEVSCCPLNFAQSAPPNSSVLNLDALNQPLVAIARLWAGDGTRVSLADLARAPDAAVDPPAEDPAP